MSLDVLQVIIYHCLNLYLSNWFQMSIRLKFVWGFLIAYFSGTRLKFNSNRKYLEILIQLIDKWDTSWKIESHNIIIRHIVQMLHNAA